MRFKSKTVYRIYDKDTGRRMYNKTVFTCHDFWDSLEQAEEAIEKIENGEKRENRYEIKEDTVFIAN